jgi:hypothetical protein
MKIKDRLRCLKHPHYSLLRLIIKFRCGSKILSGPFCGMSFNIPNFNTAMLLGTWEKELANTINEFKEITPSSIICIGAAEGYYAVGLAKDYPNLTTYAFEQNIKYRILLNNLALENHCTNIKILGKCNNESLSKTLDKSGEKPLIICDIEGGEIDLLDIHAVPLLENSFILVEVHEMYVQDCENVLLKRFSSTHESKIIGGSVRDIKDIPHKIKWLRLISSKSRLLNLMNEGRPYPMNWILFYPNKHVL